MNEFCPNDFYVMDGLTCADAYCYEGRCQTYDFQCKHLFAQGTVYEDFRSQSAYRNILALLLF